MGLRALAKGESSVGIGSSTVLLGQLKGSFLKMGFSLFIADQISRLGRYSTVLPSSKLESPVGLKLSSETVDCQVF